jgi:hypothetical protein
MSERTETPKRATRGERSRTIPSEGAPAVSLGRHKRCCTVCRHAQRAAIEEDFLLWRSPDDITEEYGLAHRSSIYRHAHATGLIHRRRRNLRWVLERIMEQVDDVPINAGSILNAVRTCASINEAGEWIAAPQHKVVTYVIAAAPGAANADSESVQRELSQLLLATNRHSRRKSSH